MIHHFLLFVILGAFVASPSSSSTQTTTTTSSSATLSSSSSSSSSTATSSPASATTAAPPPPQDKHKTKHPSLPLALATACPPLQARIDEQRFHANYTCGHRGQYTRRKQQRHIQRICALQHLSTTAGVPNQQTIHCPSDDDDDYDDFDDTTTTTTTRLQDWIIPLMSSHPNMNTGTTTTTTTTSFTQQQQPQSTIVGLDTTWIVENTASVPVVVSLLSDGRHGYHHDTSTVMPKIILQPGEWRPIETYEGHIFEARTVLENGNDDDDNGLLLLRHRVGLIPVSSPHEHYDCGGRRDDDDDDDDDDPDISQYLSRTPPPPTNQDLQCNLIYVGFRNENACPLHAYWVQPPPISSPSSSSASASSKQPRTTSCNETFQFHLGTQTYHLNNFMMDWTSNTKYEATLLGHTFHFRLAHHPQILVDRITLQPTQIRDCPHRLPPSTSKQTTRTVPDYDVDDEDFWIKVIQEALRRLNITIQLTDKMWLA